MSKLAYQESNILNITPKQFYFFLSQNASGSIKLKLLDVMLLEEKNGKKCPSVWLFTDTKGFLNSRLLDPMHIDDLIKAIITNIEGTDHPIIHSDILVLNRPVSHS